MTMDPTEPVTPAVSPSPAPAVSPAPAPVVAVAPRAKSAGVLNLLLVGAAVVAVGGVAFAIGRTTAPASAFPGGLVTNGGPIVRTEGSFKPGAGGPGGVALSGAFTMDGTVKSIDADSVTLTLDEWRGRDLRARCEHDVPRGHRRRGDRRCRRRRGLGQGHRWWPGLSRRGRHGSGSDRPRRHGRPVGPSER